MKAILFNCLMIISSLSLAGNVGYEVELIIFEDTTEQYKFSENWALEKNNDSEKKESIIKEKENLIFKFIKSENYRLNKQAEKLQKNARYNILYHKAWKQPGLDKKSAVPIIINTDKNTPTEETNGPSSTSSFISGRFKLIMSRYLHVDTQLILHKPIKSAKALVQEKSNDPSTTKNIDAKQYTQYPFTFERRMRSKEVHYLDHPLGGIIVLATPYRIKEKNKEQQPVKGYKTL